MFSPCIGKIPAKLNGFFDDLRAEFGAPAFRHLAGYVLALAVATGRRNVKTLHRWIPDGACRQNVTDFLIAAPWDAAPVLRRAAMNVLATAKRPVDHTLYFIIDATKSAKRGRKMEGGHKFYVPMGGRAAWGHEFLLAAVKLGDACVPFAVELYAPRDLVQSPRGRDLGLTFRNLNDLAAKVIREIPQEILGLFKVVVLFDAGFFNETVVSACQERGLTFISRAPNNRTFFPDRYTGKRTLERYAPGVVRYEGTEIRLKGRRGERRFRVAHRDGRMKKVGRVRVVFSQRIVDGRRAHLVTNDFSLDPREVVEGYLQRWPIEVLIKTLKQRLGLGDYQTGSFTGVLRHLHLVCLAHLALTHLGLTTPGAGNSRAGTSTPRSPSIQDLQDRLRLLVWRDHTARLKRRKNGSAIVRAIEEALPMAA